MNRPSTARADLIRRRLAGQYLTTSGPKTGADVVRALGAVQAQDYAGAKWAVAQRTTGATDADMERELIAGSILRTHLLRPTWHFVAPLDIRWMLALTAPRVIAAMAYHDRFHELTPGTFRRSNAALTKALAGGKHLTRLELAKVLERARLGTTSGQLVGLMMRAELDAVVCSGPRRGKQFTYALFDERVPPAAALERDAALLELTRRYFSTRGPATVRDFAWWSGLTLADSRRAIDIAGPELAHVTLDDSRYYFIDRDLPKARPSAHLLPNYDEYFIGYKDRGAIGHRLGHSKPVTGGNALISHVVFVDGQLVGKWKQRIETTQVAVDLDLAVPLTRAERHRIVAAANRLGAFHRLPVTVIGEPRF
jgi:hypothetical protein